MAALTPTLVVSLDASAGTKKLKIFTVTPSSESDAVALATHFSSIDKAFAFISAGMDAALSAVQPTHSDTTVTLAQKGEDGEDATNWTSASITLIVIGEDAGV